MLWIKDIVEGTQAPPFWTNSRVDMFGFVYPHKVVHRRNIFLVFPSARNGGELEGGAKNGSLMRQFSQVKRDLDLQEIHKPIPIPKNRTPRK